jgi:hypothetical protein
MDLFCGDDREQQMAYIIRTLERDFKDVSLCRWVGEKMESRGSPYC